MRLFWSVACVALCLVAGCRSAPERAETPGRIRADTNHLNAVRAYDAGFCDAVSSHWVQLLQNNRVPQDNGEVVLQFELHDDGQLSGLQIPKNTEGLNYGLLCQSAVTDPAPYARWPAELRKVFGTTRRFEVTFQFDVDGNGFLAYVADWNRDQALSGPPPATKIVFYLPSKRRMEEAAAHPWGNQIPSRKVLEINRNGRTKGADFLQTPPPFWDGMPYFWNQPLEPRDFGKPPNAWSP